MVGAVNRYYTGYQPTRRRIEGSARCGGGLRPVLRYERNFRGYAQELELYEKYDFALSKGFGQNFIVNPGLPPKIVDASGVDKRYGVLEIGPGIGVLTRELAKRAAKVVSIEVDERLPPLLAETMAGVDNSSWYCRMCSR